MAIKRYKKARRDYGPIKKTYETSYLSLSELSEMYGVSSTTISRKAKEEGWERLEDYECTQPKMPKHKRGGPRPKFAVETREYILHEISNGRTLTEILREKNMPSGSTFGYWLNTVEGFREAYEDAIATAANLLMHRSIDTIGRIEANEINGKDAKVIIDSLIKIASKMDVRWSDKQSIDHTSNGQSVQMPNFTLNSVSVPPIDDTNPMDEDEDEIENEEDNE